MRPMVKSDSRPQTVSSTTPHIGIAVSFALLVGGPATGSNRTGDPVCIWTACRISLQGEN
mgnify:CR=1